MQIKKEAKVFQKSLEPSLVFHFVFIWFAVAYFPEKANSFTLTISNRQYSGLGVALQSTLDAQADAIQTQFNNSIASKANTDQFLVSMGNANAGSSRSYLSPGVITSNSNIAVSLSGGIALAVGNGASLSNGIKTSSNTLPPVGVGAKSAVSVGISGTLLKLHLGRLDPKRTMVNLTFGTLNLSSLLGNGVTMKSTQMGAGLAYQVYEPRSWTPLVRFNGIRISSGLVYSYFDASYSTPFNLSQVDSTSGATMTWNNNIDLAVNSSVFSFTNEVTTGVRLFWIWNLFTGVGVDFNVGSSSITGGSTGSVSATIPPSGSSIFTASSTVSGDSPSATPSLAQLRYILGTELDLGALAIYVQGEAATPSVYSLNFGAHVLF